MGGSAKARSAAGIKELYFYDLSHTFATRAVKAGVDLLSLMKFLGHKAVITTQRYFNLRDVDILPATEKFKLNVKEADKRCHKNVYN